MGWESTHVGSNITTRAFIEYYIRRTYDGIYESVKIFEGKNIDGQKAFYVALKKLEDNSIFASVFLTERRNGQVAVKIIGESAQPFYYEAPESFINVLTPSATLEGAWWRNRCLESKEEVA